MVQARKPDKRKQYSPDEIRAMVKKMEKDPKIQALMAKAREESARGEGITLSEYKKLHGFN